MKRVRQILKAARRDTFSEEKLVEDLDKRAEIVSGLLQDVDWNQLPTYVTLAVHQVVQQYFKDKVQQTVVASVKSSLEAWSIKQLKEAMTHDLANCQTDSQRDEVKAFCGNEIKKKAEEFSRIRKLTPGEIAIAEEFGYNANEG